jgi:sporulation protein YlmC with PRC-barrel domain
MKLQTNRRILGVVLLTLVFGGLPSVSHGQEAETSVLASRIIDQDVYDAKPQLIGEVDDIVIRRSGRVKKLTVEFGGFLGIGDKLVAVSFKKFNLKTGGIYLDATAQELEKMPEFNYYRKGLVPEYYYSRVRPYQGPYDYPLGYPQGPYGPRSLVPPDEWAFSPRSFLASVVLDRRVINEDGQDIGIVKDLLINRKNNMVAKVIISSEGILGNDTYVEVPYKPLGFTPYGVVYDITPAKLKEMPKYSYPE